MKTVWVLSCIFFASCVLGEFLHGPGGRLYNTDCVITVPNGATFLHDRMILADGTEQPVSNACGNNASRPVAREADGWNEYTYYYPTPGSLDQFNGDWTVPGGPGLGYRGETIFLFTGLQPPDGSFILQPVLQWGYSAIGGGATWYVAIWYVYGSTAVSTTGLVPVNPGQTISTNMIRYPGSYWNSNIWVDGNLVAAANFPDRDYNVAFNTLEVYGVRDCGSLPYQTNTNFFNLQVHQLGGGFLTPAWTGQINQGDCGQNVGCSATNCVLYYGVPPVLSPAVFDAGYYKSVNSDLPWGDAPDLDGHWENFGINEGRLAVACFYVNEYKAIYPDLAPLANIDAVNHYAIYGYGEGRIGRYYLHPLAFDYYFYISTYSDLESAYGAANDKLGAYNHWVDFGCSEGRQGVSIFSAPAYLSYYPDLQAAFGANYLAATYHWVTTGYYEGRRGV